METLFWIVCGVFLWTLVGCLVLALIDDGQQSLLRWAKSAPHPILESAVVLIWPVVAFFWFWRR